jgi:hypothetical protein
MCRTVIIIRMLARVPSYCRLDAVTVQVKNAQWLAKSDGGPKNDLTKSQRRQAVAEEQDLPEDPNRPQSGEWPAVDPD